MKTILIDGIIGTGKDEISSSAIRAMLPENGTDEIVVKIHSEGGSVIEGFRIYDLFAAYQGKKTAIIESAAYSIASFIPMAFDEVEIAPNGYLMLHNPYMQAEGDDEDLAKLAGTLSKMKTNMIAAYSAKSRKTTEDIAAILKQETYLNATEAVAMGFCDRITAATVYGRVFAKLNTMPHGVVAALFGADSGGGNNSNLKDEQMSTTVTRVPATVKQIKSAYPKAKAEFVVKCAEKEMPIEEVAAEYSDEIEKENETLSAKVKAMEEELTALKAAKAQEDEEAIAKAKAMEEAEEDDAEAKAKKSGVAAVAKARSASAPSAKAKWESELQSRIQSGHDRPKALKSVERDFPGLRVRMLQEINGN